MQDDNKPHFLNKSVHSRIEENTLLAFSEDVALLQADDADGPENSKFIIETRKVLCAHIINKSIEAELHKMSKHDKIKNLYMEIEFKECDSLYSRSFYLRRETEKVYKLKQKIQLNYEEANWYVAVFGVKPTKLNSTNEDTDNRQSSFR